jgi:DNA-binding PadR family transcriptional regulator
MSIKHTILGLLARGPLHGYDLKAAFLRDLAPRDADLNWGQVYTTLDRLQRDGLVTPELVAQEKQPDKKVYSLTTDGRSELKEWLATPSKHDLDLRNETYLKLMLARRLPWADPLEVLTVERRACFQKLREVTQARAETDKKDIPTRLLLDLAVLRLEAFLKWLDHCEETLEREEKKK